MWPSSLTRAGYSKVHLDVNDATYATIHKRQPVDVLCAGRRIQLPCKLIATSKFRNGRERWWCPVHQGVYGKKSEIETSKITGVWKCDYSHELIDYFLEADVPVFDVEQYSNLSVSLRFPPFFTNLEMSVERLIDIHIHTEICEVVTDNFFSAVYIKNVPDVSPTSWGHTEKGFLIVLPAALEIFFQTELFGGKNSESVIAKYRTLIEPGFEFCHLNCKKCGNLHDDVGDYFGVNVHRKHLCGSCGMEFSGPFPSIAGIGNSLIVFLIKLEQSLEHAQAINVKNQKVWLHNPTGVELTVTTPNIFSKGNVSELKGVRYEKFEKDNKTCAESLVVEVVIVNNLTVYREFNRELGLGEILEKLFWKKQ
jgi:hypothetical protein